MAEIKRLNSSVPMAGAGYAATAMDLVHEGERSRLRARRLQAALHKYWVALAAVAVIFTILMQSIAIYAMQQNVASISNEIISLQRSNENLRITVMKARDLGQTRQDALAEEFIARSEIKPLAVDLAYDNFTAREPVEAALSWWGKLFAFIQ